MLISCQLLWQYKISSSFRKRNQKKWWQVQRKINNSGFVSIKFNLIIFDINSYYQTADLNVLFQSLFSFKTWTKFSKETLAATLLFRCNFLLVVEAGNLIWQFYFFIGFVWHGAGSILKFSLVSAYFQLVHNLYINIPWD